MSGFHDIDFGLNETYEYAFSPVPTAKRKSVWRLVPILMVFAFSSTGLNVGVGVGQAHTFSRAVTLCLLGSILLFLTALFWGLLGFRHGLGCTSLVRKYLGRMSASVLSVLITLAVIVWNGVNADMLAKVFLAVIPGTTTPLPVVILAVVVTGAVIAGTGWRGMEITSLICAPLIFLLTVCNLVQIVTFGGMEPILAHSHSLQLPVSEALTMVMGSFFVSAVTVPNITRFAKSRWSVVLCAAVYGATIFLCCLCGIMITQSTGAHNLSYGVYLLGIGMTNILWITICGYATQNVDMYTGSLAIQSIVRRTRMGGNISHGNAVRFLAAASVIAGILNFTAILPLLTDITILVMAPLTGIMLSEHIIGKSLPIPRPITPLAAWAIGVGLGWLVSPLTGDSLLPSTIVSGAVYLLMREQTRHREPLAKNI